MTQALAAIRAAVAKRERLFLTTPNINFAIAALTDQSFRASVLQSDLCLMDGMPLVWLAKLLRIPIKERVAGANLFERLLADPGPPIRVYFFGGPDGVAQQASDTVNARGGAVRCVGHCSPGFKSVEALSESSYLNAINSSGADMVVVALGAKKGQEWLVRNAAILTAPVITHLGAVVNFVAGTVRRSPPWMQRTGLEWLWRIAAEPTLWRRYAIDGKQLLLLLAKQLMRNLTARSVSLPDSSDKSTIKITEESGHIRISLKQGSATTVLPSLQDAFALASDAQRRVVLDLQGTDALNPRIIGLILLAETRLQGLEVTGVSKTLAAQWLRPATGINASQPADTIRGANNKTADGS
jgi:N-acetylglucosaminyldiphosphoundecaprenol N-acetyl-beta-D-mannosaminyltransferase